jgi:hypothetical protein
MQQGEIYYAPSFIIDAGGRANAKALESVSEDCIVHRGPTRPIECDREMYGSNPGTIRA